jgi:hypothetical protein
MRELTVAAHISSLLQAIENCRASKNQEWELRHAARIKAIIAGFLPSGNGWDLGTTLDPGATPQKLMFDGAYHHVDSDSGMYDGWTDHTITVRPTFDGVDVSVGGRDRNGVKGFISEWFHIALTATVPQAEWIALCEKADGAKSGAYAGRQS